MSATAVGQRCHRCDRIIRAGGHEVTQHSASGARPSTWEHDIRDPACTSIQVGAEHVHPGRGVVSREARLAQEAAYVLAHAETPPDSTITADWIAYLTNGGGLVAHGVRCFHFQAEGRRTPAAEQALAEWDTAVRLPGGWPKAVALAEAVRDLLDEEDRHQARRRARQAPAL